MRASLASRYGPPSPARHRPSPGRVAVTTVTVAAVMVVSAVWFQAPKDLPTNRSAQGTTNTPMPRADEEGPLPRSREVPTRAARNRQGGYALRYPIRWRIEKLGAITQLTAPGSRTVVSIGRGTRQGPRRVALSIFRAATSAGYRKLGRLGVEARRFAGGRAYLIAAKGMNQAKVRLRIVFGGVKRGAKTFPITVFTAEGTDPARVLPRVEAIARSLGPLTKS